jgi:hypothetical protein
MVRGRWLFGPGIRDCNNSLRRHSACTAGHVQGTPGLHEGPLAPADIRQSDEGSRGINGVWPPRKSQPVNVVMPPINTSQVRRLKASLMRATAHEGLEHLLRPFVEHPSDAREMAESWAARPRDGAPAGSDRGERGAVSEPARHRRPAGAIGGACREDGASQGEACQARE